MSDDLQDLTDMFKEMRRQARYSVILAAAPVQQHAVAIGLITDPEASRTAAANLREAAEHGTGWSDHTRQTAREYADWFEQQAQNH